MDGLFEVIGGRHINISADAYFNTTSDNLVFANMCLGREGLSNAFIIQLILLWCLCAAGMMGNGLVIFRVCTDTILRTPTFVAIASLALADALSLLAHFISTLSTNFTMCGVVQYNALVCKLFTVLKYGSKSASMWHLPLLTALRFYILIYPLKAGAYLQMRHVLFCSFVIWGASIVYAGCLSVGMQSFEGYLMSSKPTANIFSQTQNVSDMFITSSELARNHLIDGVDNAIWNSANTLPQERNRSGTFQNSSDSPEPDMPFVGRCMFATSDAPANDLFVIIIDEVINGLCPLLTMLLLQTVKTCRLAKRSNAISATTGVQRDVSKTVFVIILLYTVCIVSLLIYDILSITVLGLRGVTSSNIEMQIVIKTVMFLGYIHHCINPVVFCLIAKQFRKSIASLFRKMKSPCGNGCS